MGEIIRFFTRVFIWSAVLFVIIGSLLTWLFFDSFLLGTVLGVGAALLGIVAMALDGVIKSAWARLRKSR